MKVTADLIRLAFDLYIDQVRCDEPAALATAALAGRLRNQLAHNTWQDDNRELLAELKDNPGRYGPPETRAMLLMLGPGPGADGPPKTAFFLFVETLAAIAAVERTSLGTLAARRLRAQAGAADTNAVWERWLELRRQQHPEESTGFPGLSRSAFHAGMSSSPLDHITREIAALLDAGTDAGQPMLIPRAPQHAQPDPPTRSGHETSEAERPRSTATATLPLKISRLATAERAKLAATIRRRYDAGESIRALATSTGRSYGFIHRILTETGAALRGRGGATRGIMQPLAAREAALVAAHCADTRLALAEDAAVTATLLQNLGPVIASLQPTKDAVIRVGALLIVKVDWVVNVYQLTAAQQAILDHHPQSQSSPHEIIAALDLPTEGHEHVSNVEPQLRD